MELFGVVALVAIEALGIVAISTFLFDVLHWALHRWARSSWPVLRWASSLHQIHHDFLGKDMQVDLGLRGRNITAHILPEFLTTVAGTLPFFWVWPAATGAVLVRHCIMLGYTLYCEGVDAHHMAMDRVDGRIPVVRVNDSFHAMHHIHPLTRYGSFFGVFDLIFGTAVGIRGRNIVLTGASGALGRAMLRRLKGAKSVTLLGREDFADGMLSQRGRAALGAADLLILCHGSRGKDCFRANVGTVVLLVQWFRQMHRGDLTPPEVWGIGSETELLGGSSYARSKRLLARHARGWYADRDLTYRHIVPAAFNSRMGWGPMSADLAAVIALFLIRRGFRYVPVTWTGGALLNWVKFVLTRPLQADAARAA